MNTLKAITITSLLAFSFAATSAFAEVSAAPSRIDLNDHVGLANYYEGLAKEVSAKLEANQQKLNEYEDHSYHYGRRGQDVRSHLRGNIRKYETELTEDLMEAELHRKSASSEYNKQFNKAKSGVNSSVIVR